MKKTIFLIFSLLIYINNIFSQQEITFIINDADTKEPLPYCNVAIKNTMKGGIANADGKIKLSVNMEKDTLEVLYLGYETKTIPAKNLQNNEIIFLAKSTYLLTEVEIRPGNDYIYDIISKCKRQMLKNNNKTTSKAYYSVESNTDSLPLELLECYYNSEIKGVSLKKLHFKNGRALLKNQRGSVFRTHNISEAFIYLNLLEANDYFPPLILNADKYSIKRKFNVKMEEVTTDYFLISFSPKKDENEYFSGKLWIDKQTNDLLKINLTVENAKIHPFVPRIFLNKISNVNLNITQNFIKKDNKMYLDYTLFNYSFDYTNNYNSATNPTNIQYNVKSNGFLYFYDYGKTFILPYFTYNHITDDYVKLSTFPYNKVFWENENKFLLSESQEKALDFLSQEKSSKDYEFNSENNYGIHSLPNNHNLLSKYRSGNSNHANSYFFWSKDDRLIISEYKQRNIEKNEVPQENNIKSKFFVQILLDLVETEDSIYWVSYTVFDPFQSYFYDVLNPNIFACVNIYFDLCEIERLKMEEKLKKDHKTVKEITATYIETTKEIDKLRKKYFQDVDLGLNERDLEKYNKSVIEELDINNIEMFKDFYKPDDK